MANIYSIIESFGRQFWVEPNKFQDVSNFKLKRKPEISNKKSFKINYSHNPEKPLSILFNRVMFFADENNVELGKPFLNQYRIEGSLLPGVKKKSKILVFKMRSKKKYRRKIGAKLASRRIRFDNILEIASSKTKANLQVLVRGS
uniref:ribosomal protein L21 n=1 Tax=Eustigmatophyceae sp. WTwin 8/9 T-6m6.8 TaxID=2974615 RepID=UPI002182413B|nr:ribosomal protein L21 [Eustigmatophyceae sp. WTwin 8/9 T-6m6.8]UVI60973.1 ribosomal protein L21 [Eustigmatophyceae sp. WTwin 8/9 T-6m6.8]